MKMTFTVLSKSAKSGNKCVAGVLENGYLVRIVSNDSSIDGAIPNWYIKNYSKGLDVQILDEIQVEVLQYLPDRIQKENFLVDTDIMPQIVGHKTIGNIIECTNTDSDPFVFLNTANFLTDQEVFSVGYSLKFIIADDIQIRHVMSYGKPKTRVDFSYNGAQYKSISVTDQDYFSTDDLYYKQAALFVSLPNQPYETADGEKRYYKFVAKIFPLSI